MGSYLKVDRSRKVTRVCRYVDGNDTVKTVNLMVQESKQKIARLGKPGDLGHKEGEVGLGWKHREPTHSILTSIPEISILLLSILQMKRLRHRK